MSRVTRWKVEKTKVKVVFRLQFHATHIPQPGWDKLFISFVPADSGKPTAKTTKANVRSGACKWGDPIYETTRLLQDIKTKQYDDKFYKLVVAMGSTRSSVLGEANVNLAHYADALKPSSVQLPLQGCDSGTTLHVTIQLLTSKTGFREFELQRELREKGLQSTSDESTVRKTASSEASANDPMDKANARVRFKGGLPPLEEADVNEEYANSVGFDGSSTASEGLYAEKHDTSSNHEIDSLKSTTSGDLVGPSLSQSPLPDKVDPSDPRFLPLGSNDWAHGWGSDYSADNDLANVYEENSRLRRSLETAESSILELKLELHSLRSHADEIGIEAQSFSQLLATELASGERLASEVAVLRLECANFKADLERLKVNKLSSPPIIGETIATGKDAVLQELQLRWLKGLLDVDDKVKEIQSKASFGLHEKDLRSFNSNIEALRGVLHDLKQGCGPAVSGLSLVNAKGSREVNLLKADQLLSGARFSSDFYQPDILLHSLDIPALMPQEIDGTNDHSAMKEFALVKEVDELKAEREALTRKMDQMECYYEALVQELEETQRRMVGELQNLRNEHSTCLYTISATKAEMENMHQEMNKQIMGFSVQKCELDSLNKDLERRSVAAEAALKRARLNYSIAVNQLQKDLELLSVQVLSMHETNENLLKQAFSDSSPSSVLGYEDAIENKKLDSKLTRCPSQFEGVMKQQLEGEIVSEDLKRSLLLQKGLYQKVEEEVYEVHLVNMYLDIFSTTLQESLLEASADFGLLKEKVAELTRHLKISTESKELLMQRLQGAMDEVHQLSGYKDAADAKCNDLALQNCHLETKVQNAAREKLSLSQKIAECETVIEELGSYKSKFQACSMEKFELENLLKKEMLESGNLQNKIASLHEEMKAARTQFDAKCNELVLQNRDLETNVQNAAHEKLSLSQKIAKCEAVIEELGSYKSKFQACSMEKFELENLLKKEVLENGNLQNKIASLHKETKAARTQFEELVSVKENLLGSVNFLQSKLQDLLAYHDENCNALAISTKNVDRGFESKDVAGAVTRLEELQRSSYEKISQLIEEKQALAQERDLLQMSLSTVELDNLAMKHKFDENGRSIMNRFNESSDLVQRLQSEVEGISDRLKLSSKVEETYAQQHKELLLAFDHLEVELQNLTSKNEVLGHEIVALESLSGELGNLKLAMTALSEEREALTLTLRDKNEESAKSEVELNSLRSSLQLLQAELDVERSTTSKLECEVTGLITQLNKKHAELLSFDRQSAELVRLRQLVAELELEKSSVLHTLSDSERSLNAAREMCSSMSSLEAHISEMHESSLASDVRHTYTQTQYESCIEELQKKYLNVESKLDTCLATEAHYIEENTKLMEGLSLLRSELDASTAQNKVLLDANCRLRTELDELKKSAECMEAVSVVNTRKHAVEVERMDNMRMKYEEEIDNLIFINEALEVTVLVLKFKLDSSSAQSATPHDANCSLRTELNEFKERTQSIEAKSHENTRKHALEVERLENMVLKYEEEIYQMALVGEEQEIKLLVLKFKLDELKPQTALLEEYGRELVMLRNKYDEITQKLSEQVLKTEEFKNLSVHLKELKDKADAELLQAREKRDEGPPPAVQESLRMVFVKEQCETKLQEMNQQLSMSKRHSEEMLLKLQDAVDEVENRKKSEASNIKRNEELGMRILELESELQSAISEKREMMKAYDLMKAEKECSSISLECCKEEKQELEASLQKCNEEKSKISVELALMKDFLESSKCAANTQTRDNGGEDQADTRSDEYINRSPTETISASVNANDCDSNDCEEVEADFLTPVNEADLSNTRVIMQQKQDIFGSLNSHSRGVKLRQEDALNGNTEHLSLVNEHFKGQSLRSSMDHLNKELEKMKYDSLLLSEEDNQIDPYLPSLQRELMQLEKVNEELGCIYPTFKELPCKGNALERLLALEIELAESLQEKKMSSLHFQSSFLKQHGDEEAVFKSFRDINELIKEMLEIKGRYAAVEAELKEMHGRYSDLSLHFAEVEGERQKLMMTLKNVRASRRVPFLNRSSTAPLGGPSP